MFMTSSDTSDACKTIDGWELVAEFSVGGFEWLGFSKKEPNKMIVISSQKTTILDCDTGKLQNCTVEYDESELIAICDKLPDEMISIAGQFGGALPITTDRGEKVLIHETDDHIMTITFVLGNGKEIKVFHCYSAYISGFSYDGNYFVISNDGGITLVKRSAKN